MLLFRGRALAPKDEVGFLTMFPHDEEAVAEGRHCNGIMANRVPGFPLLAVRCLGLPRWLCTAVDDRLAACASLVPMFYRALGSAGSILSGAGTGIHT